MPVGPELPPASRLSPAAWADETIRRIDADGLRRRLRVRHGGSGRTAVVDGQEVVVFSSNDYLGLATHPAVVRAAANAAVERGVGSTGSRHLSGGHDDIVALEAELCAFEGAEAATLAPSGYAANLAVLQALGGGDCTILSDERNHASIIDGARLSRGQVVVYPHRDLDALGRLLGAASSRPIIVSDTVFSMDGTVADVAGLQALAQRHHAWLVLDEAHATGVLGPGGRGAAAAAGIDVRDPEMVRVVTLSKALGAAGAAVLGSASVRELLLNRGRALIYTSAPPHPEVAAARAALATLQGMPELVQRLRENALYLRGRLGPMGDHGEPGVPIIPVMCGDPLRAVAVERTLLRRGHLVQAVRPPTVAPGTSRLRIAVAATHTTEELDALATDLLELRELLDRDAEVTGKPVPTLLAARRGRSAPR